MVSARNSRARVHDGHGVVVCVVSQGSRASELIQAGSV
jgi:hypothetical protein